MAAKSINIRAGFDMKAFSTSSQNLTRSLENTGKKMKSIGQSMSMYVTAPIVGMMALSLKAFDEQAKSIAQVEAGLKSTGNAVGITSQQLQKMASDLQKTSLFGDEEILKNATAQLLTFTNIAGSEFKRTQEAALNLATRLDGDLKSSSIMLGKALNDPVANLSALSRAGIQFSTEQKTLVKSLVETNRLADAQNLILDELEKQYGGSAEAAARAGLGPFKQLQMSIGDLSEEFGAIIAEYLIPFADKLKGLAESFSELSDGTKKTIVVIAALAAAIGPLIFMVGALSTAFAFLLANPIVLAIVGVTLVIGGLAIAMSDASDKTVELTKTQQLLGKTSEEYQKNLDGEKAKLDNVFAKLKQTNKGSKDRKRLIDEINSTYGTTLKNLTDEDAFINQLDTSYADLIKSMTKKVKLSLKEDVLKDLLTIESELTSSIENIGKSIENIPRNNFGAIIGDINAPAAAETEKNNKKHFDTLLEQQKKFTKELAENKAEQSKIFQGDFLKDLTPTPTKTITANIKETIESSLDGMVVPMPTLDFSKLNIANPNDLVKVKPIEIDVKMNKDGFDQAVESIGNFATTAQTKALKIGEEMGAALSNGLQDLATEGLVSFGKFLGDVMSGGDMTIEDFGLGLLDSIGKFMGQFGEAMIAMGIAEALLQTSIATMNPAAAIIGGVALVAAGAAISSLSKKGIDTGLTPPPPAPPPPFLGGGGSEGFMNSMDIRISGRDLILVQERERAFTR